MRRLSTSLKKCRAATLALSLGAMATAASAQEGPPDASELARQSSNPLGGDFMLLINQFDNYWMDGQIPGADDENIHTYTVQPVLSLPLRNYFGEGWSFVDRPTIPMVLSAGVPSLGGAGCDINITPICDPGDIDTVPPGVSFSDKSGFADASNFFLFGYTWDSSLPDGGQDMIGAGFANTFPIGASAFSSERWSVGPSFVAAHLGQKFIVGALGQQFWGIGETGNCDGCPQVNQMLLQYFYYINLEDGWQIGGSPLAVFNWETNEHSIPIALGVSKTGPLIPGVPIPFKVGIEANYYVESPEIYGQEWDLKIIVAPILPSPLKPLLPSFFD